MADIVITEDGGVGLFHLPADAALPRVGDTLLFYFTASDQERAEFAGDSLRHNDALHGQSWKVIKVEHHFNKYAWNKSRCTTWVWVKRDRASTTVKPK